MSKICPLINSKVVYLECLECEDKICMRIKDKITTPREPFLASNPSKTTTASQPSKK